MIQLNIILKWSDLVSLSKSLTEYNSKSTDSKQLPIGYLTTLLCLSYGKPYCVYFVDLYIHDYIVLTYRMMMV